MPTTMTDVLTTFVAVTMSAWIETTITQLPVNKDPGGKMRHQDLHLDLEREGDLFHLLLYGHQDHHLDQFLDRVDQVMERFLAGDC